MIKKADAIANLTREEDEEAAKLESYIDGKLKTFKVRELIYVSKYSERVIERVAEAYRKSGGWNVIYEVSHDQRDQRDESSWLVFT